MTQLMVKDVKLSQAAAAATGSPTPLAAMALTFYEKAMESGYAAKDFSAVFRWLAEQKRD
jgi:3-hydroxyisobutyrate dehydrogenase